LAQQLQSTVAGVQAKQWGNMRTSHQTSRPSRAAKTAVWRGRLVRMEVVSGLTSPVTAAATHDGAKAATSVKTVRQVMSGG
jgi:hypothetical protein